MKTLNIIGCGRVGRTLGRLWTDAGVFRVQDILNRSPGSAARAVDFVGAGTAVRDCASLRHADVCMISVADDSIAECCGTLAGSGRLRAGSVVFHCSGGLSSTVLSAASQHGALAASVHPLKSFADPSVAVDSFPGTFCGLEGDAAAVDLLRAAFQHIGAETFAVDAELKAVYHAATVVASNYLVALLDVALRAGGQAGLPRAMALKLIAPLVRGTVDNVFRLDTTAALTGPIARGDHALVQRHCEALRSWDPDVERLYRELGKVALELSRAQGSAEPEDLAELERVLATGTPD